MTSISILDLKLPVFYVVVFIQMLTLFFFFLFGLSVSNAGGKGNWFKAFVLAVCLPLLGILPVYIGPFGWFVAFIISIFLLSKVLVQEMLTAFLTLVIVGIIQQIVEFSIHHLS